MAYFQHDSKKEETYTRQFAPVRDEEYEEDWDDEEYDDGFDELLEPEEAAEEADEDAVREEKRRKFRIAAGVGDLGGILIGVGVILALVYFLINVLRFVTTDFKESFSLLQTKF